MALAKWGLELDLIDFVRVPPTLQAEILRNGKKLFVKNEHDLATMIMRAMRSYQMLNEERERANTRKKIRSRWMETPLLKIDSIRRCLARVSEMAALNPTLMDQNNLDVVVLNLQRACEQSLDLAN